jgi:putative membrane protein
MFATEGFNLWWLIPIVLIGLCFFGARGCCSGRRHSALDILSGRYARGEIDDEEYERKRKAITQERKGETR